MNGPGIMYTVARQAWLFFPLLVATKELRKIKVMLSNFWLVFSNYEDSCTPKMVAYCSHGHWPPMADGRRIWQNRSWRFRLYSYTRSDWLTDLPQQWKLNIFNFWRRQRNRRSPQCILRPPMQLSAIRQQSVLMLTPGNRWHEIEIMNFMWVFQS